MQETNIKYNSNTEEYNLPKTLKKSKLYDTFRKNKDNKDISINSRFLLTDDDLNIKNLEKIIDSYMFWLKTPTAKITHCLFRKKRIFSFQTKNFDFINKVRLFYSFDIIRHLYNQGLVELILNIHNFEGLKYLINTGNIKNFSQIIEYNNLKFLNYCIGKIKIDKKSIYDSCKQGLFNSLKITLENYKKNDINYTKLLNNAIISKNNNLIKYLLGKNILIKESTIKYLVLTENINCTEYILDRNNNINICLLYTSDAADE